MEKFGIGNETYQIIKVADQSFSIFKWKDFELNLLLFFIIVFALIDISGGQAMIIHYIRRYAKKGRPFNKLNLVDQVYLTNICNQLTLEQV